MKSKHWTEESTDAFVYRIASDFVEQLERKRKKLKWSRRRLAEELNLTPGRISQVINGNNNLTLELMVKVARALELKVSVVAYGDGDKQNFNGPINADVFLCCWENAGRPKEKWDLEQKSTAISANTGHFTKFANLPLTQKITMFTGEHTHAGATGISFQLSGTSGSVSTPCKSDLWSMGDFSEVCVGCQ